MLLKKISATYFQRKVWSLRDRKVYSFALHCWSDWIVQILTIDWYWIFGLIFRLEIISETTDQTELLSSLQKFTQIMSQSKVSSENQVWFFYWNQPGCLSVSCFCQSWHISKGNICHHWPRYQNTFDVKFTITHAKNSHKIKDHSLISAVGMFKRLQWITENTSIKQYIKFSCCRKPHKETLHTLEVHLFWDNSGICS